MASPMMCPRCNDTGVYETGSNDEPCTCSLGAAAVFNVSVPGRGPVSMTGAELDEYHRTGAVPTRTA